MVPGESPAVARRRLRLALRRAREASRLTQGQVAAALDWSMSKVNRIESGEVTVSGTDLLALLRLFGVEDPVMVDRMTHDARASRRRGWWDEARYRVHLTPATMKLLQFESEATMIRVFQGGLVPGALQTRAYAQAVFDFWAHEFSEEDRAVRLEVRNRRREQLFGRPDPPQYLLIMDEAVTAREVGGPAVMAEQLRDLRDMIRKGNVILRLVPLAEAGVMATLGAFQVLDLGDEESAVVYRERYNSDEIIDSPEIARRHRQIFDQIWDQSMNPDASVRLIEARAAVMLSSLDTRGPG